MFTNLLELFIPLIVTYYPILILQEICWSTEHEIRDCFSMQDPQVKIERTPETQIEKAEEKHSKPYLRKQPRVLLKNQKKGWYFT